MTLTEDVQALETTALANIVAALDGATFPAPGPFLKSTGVEWRSYLRSLRDTVSAASAILAATPDSTTLETIQQHAVDALAAALNGPTPKAARQRDQWAAFLESLTDTLSWSQELLDFDPGA